MAIVLVHNTRTNFITRINDKNANIKVGCIKSTSSYSLTLKLGIATLVVVTTLAIFNHHSSYPTKITIPFAGPQVAEAFQISRQFPRSQFLSLQSLEQLSHCQKYESSLLAVLNEVAPVHLPQSLQPTGFSKIDFNVTEDNENHHEKWKASKSCCSSFWRLKRHFLVLRRSKIKSFSLDFYN